SGGLWLRASLFGEKKEAAAGVSRGRAKRPGRGPARCFCDLCMSREKKKMEEKERGRVDASEGVMDFSGRRV
ncbi:hypothetical protein HAX54_011814, partial [Datura stramonium]|nr:hypothetical protein [Datura stramonium]